MADNIWVNKQVITEHIVQGHFNSSDTQEKQTNKKIASVAYGILQSQALQQHRLYCYPK